MYTRFVVTGCAGFIGAALTRRLLEDGHSVTGIDCFLDSYPRKRKEERLVRLVGRAGFNFTETDIASAELTELTAGAECVFHLAAQPGVRTSWGANFSEYTRNNVLATQRILEATKDGGVPRFVYSSSSSVYGDARVRPTAESEPPAPVSPYGVTKLAGEHLCHLYSSSYGVECFCLRYFTVYGPQPRPDQAVDVFVRAIRDGRQITVFGDGEQQRDMTYVDDVVEANLLASRTSTAHRIFNVGGGTCVTVHALIARLEKIVGERTSLTDAKPIAGDALHTEADSRLAAEELGWRPQIDIEEGLCRTVGSILSSR